MALTENEKDQFVNDGYICLRSAFNPDHPKIKKWKEDIWQRCEVDQTKPEIWPERVHLPSQDNLSLREIAPEAYEKSMEVIGGEDKTAHELNLHNGFIINFSLMKNLSYSSLKDIEGWHADGDFFRHFLDSGEQSLLFGCYFNDIPETGGATLISPGSHHVVARFLSEHPEGVLPNFVGQNNLKEKCSRFIEFKAKAGDICLMHPFMLHASSPNKSGRPRLMTNNNVSLLEPMCFNRKDKAYSLVEKTILYSLGMTSFDFQITGERETIVPERVRIQQELAAKNKV